MKLSDVIFFFVVLLLCVVFCSSNQHQPPARKMSEIASKAFVRFSDTCFGSVFSSFRSDKLSRARNEKKPLPEMNSAADLISVLTQKTMERLSTCSDFRQEQRCQRQPTTPLTTTTTNSINEIQRNENDEDDDQPQPPSSRRENSDRSRATKSKSKTKKANIGANEHRQQCESSSSSSRFVHVSWSLFPLLTSSSGDGDELVKLCDLIERQHKFEEAKAQLEHFRARSLNMHGKLLQQSQDDSSDNDDDEDITLSMTQILIHLIEATIHYGLGTFDCAVEQFSLIERCLSKQRKGSVMRRNRTRILNDQSEWRSIDHAYSCAIQGLISSKLMHRSYRCALWDLFTHWRHVPIGFATLDFTIVLLCSVPSSLLLKSSLSLLVFVLFIVFVGRIGRRTRSLFSLTAPRASKLQREKELSSLSPLSQRKSNVDCESEISEAPSPVTAPYSLGSIDFPSLYTRALSSNGKRKLSKLPSDSVLDGEGAIYGQRVVAQPLYQHKILDLYQPIRQNL